MAKGLVGLEIADGEYRIRCGTDYSEEAPFGEPIEWKAPNSKLYIAMCDLPEGSEESDSIESLLDHYVYECKPVATSDDDVEEVDSFGGEEEGEGEGEGEEDDEDDAGGGDGGKG